MGPKWCPNRIFDAEALRKPLGGLLERSWRLLEPKKQRWNRSWAALGPCYNAQTPDFFSDRLRIASRKAAPPSNSPQATAQRQAPPLQGGAPRTMQSSFPLHLGGAGRLQPPSITLQACFPESAALRFPSHSPPNPPSFSYVEEAIEAFRHLQSREAKASSVLSGIRRGLCASGRVEFWSSLLRIQSLFSSSPWGEGFRKARIEALASRV